MPRAIPGCRCGAGENAPPSSRFRTSKPLHNSDLARRRAVRPANGSHRLFGQTHACQEGVGDPIAGSPFSFPSGE
jgi:hypothetical protein